MVGGVIPIPECSADRGRGKHRINALSGEGRFSGSWDTFEDRFVPPVADSQLDQVFPLLFGEKVCVHMCDNIGDSVLQDGLSDNGDDQAWEDLLIHGQSKA